TGGLFLASVFPKCQIKGIKMTRAKKLAWMPMEMACVQPKFSSLVQMSRTLTGLLVKFAGGSFAGKKTSLMRLPKPPKFVPQETASRLFTGPLGTGRELKKSLKLSKTPAPNEGFTNGAPGRSLTLTGRSVRNCFRLDQKLSGISKSGAPNFGTAAA